MIKPSNTVVILGLLISASLLADTEVQKLKDIFDVAYNEAFPQHENMFISKAVDFAPLPAAMKQIVAYVYSHSPSFAKTASYLKDAADKLIDVPVRIAHDYPRGLVMASFHEWKVLSVDLIGNKWPEAIFNDIASARDETNRSRRTTRDTELIKFLNSIGAYIEKAVLKIQNDAGQAKVHQFSVEQAEISARGLLTIYNKFNNNKERWARIMDLVGVDGSVSPKI